MAARDETPPENGSQPASGRGSILLALAGPIARAELSDLCEEARGLLEGLDGDLVDCDVRGLSEPDAVAVEALARLQLIAIRLGRRIRLRHACRELQELLILMGLRDVIPLAAGLALETSRKAEQRKEARGIEEEADAADPAR